MPDATLPAPPGRMGVPVVGETLALLRNPFRFLEERQQRYGDVFKSRVLGRPGVFLAGPKGAEAFYDGENVTRAGAHPYPLVDLFGGINIEMYDGPKHFALKTIALAAFDDDAIVGYLGDMQGLIEKRLSAWATRSEFSATAELRRLAIEAICMNFMGLQPGPATDAMCRDYAAVIKGFVSLPLALPGTPYGRARAARDRLLSTIRHVIAERRAQPSDDGLSTMLATRASDGTAYSDEEAALEVHHVVIAGFAVYVLMAEVMRQLADSPELAERCAAEIAEHSPVGPLTMEDLRQLRTSTHVVMEAKRFAPVVPLAFGRAQRTFPCGGFQVPADWTVYLALSRCNQDSASFRRPDLFDPDRFDDQRAEHRKHPMAFIPQGAAPWTGHQCLGLEYSTVLVLSFLTLLVRNYEWELPPQDLSYRWSTIPPEPRDGLRVRMQARPGG